MSLSPSDSGITLPPITGASVAGVYTRASPVTVPTSAGGTATAVSGTANTRSQSELLTNYANPDPSMLGFQKFADAAIQNMAGTFVALLQSYHKQANQLKYIDSRCADVRSSSAMVEQKVSDMETAFARERERTTERIIELRKEFTTEQYEVRRTVDTGTKRIQTGLDGVDRDLLNTHQRMRALELRLARCEAIQGMPVDESTLADLMGLATGQPVPPSAHTKAAHQQFAASLIPQFGAVGPDGLLANTNTALPAPAAQPQAASQPPPAAVPDNGVGTTTSAMFPAPEPTSRQVNDQLAEIMKRAGVVSSTTSVVSGGTTSGTSSTASLPPVTTPAAKPANAVSPSAAVESVAAPPAAKGGAAPSSYPGAANAAAAFAAAFIASSKASTSAPPSAATTPASAQTAAPTPVAQPTTVAPANPQPTALSTAAAAAGNKTTTTTSTTTNTMNSSVDAKQQHQLTLLQQFAAQQSTIKPPAANAVSSGQLPMPTGAMTISNLGNVVAVTNATFNTRMEYHERVMANLEATLRAVLANLEEIVFRLNSDAGEKKRADDTLSTTIDSLNDLTAKFSAQSTVLEGQIKNYKADFDRALETKLSLIERAVGKELDTMAADKASRTELDVVNQRLLLVTEKTVEREEYSRALHEISSAMADTIEERRRHIREIANQLQVIVQAVASKASKSDLIDVASVLNTFPHVALELEQLKEFVQVTISEKTDRLVENSVDRRTLKLSLQNLMKRLKTEVAGLVSPGPGGVTGTVPHQCETCAVRLGTTSGPSCLSCSAKLKPAGLATAVPVTVGPGVNAAAHAFGDPAGVATDREMVAARGGGFSLSAPKRTGLQPDPSAMLGIGAMYGVAANPAAAAAASNAASANASHTASTQSIQPAAAASGKASARRPSRGPSPAKARVSSLSTPLVPTAVTSAPNEQLQLQPQSQSAAAAPAPEVAPSESNDTLPLLGASDSSTATVAQPQPQQILDEKYQPVATATTEQKTAAAAGSATAAATQLAAAAASLGAGGEALAVDSGRTPGGWSGIKLTESTTPGDSRLYATNGTGRTHRMIISPRGKPRTYKRVVTTGGSTVVPAGAATGETASPPAAADDHKSTPAAAGGAAASSGGSSKPHAHAHGRGVGGSGSKQPHKPSSGLARPWND